MRDSGDNNDDDGFSCMTLLDFNGMALFSSRGGLLSQHCHDYQLMELLLIVHASFSAFVSSDPSEFYVLRRAAQRLHNP